METNYYSVSLCQSIEAESEQKAIDTFIENMQNSFFEPKSIEIEFDFSLTD